MHDAVTIIPFNGNEINSCHLYGGKLGNSHTTNVSGIEKAITSEKRRNVTLLLAVQQGSCSKMKQRENDQ